MRCFKNQRQLFSIINCVKLHCRSASTFQRPQMTQLPQEKMKALKTDFFLNCKEITPEKWNTIRDTLISNYRHINRNNVDATILGLCNEVGYLSLAKDYVEFLRGSDIEPNIATMGRLLRVYNTAYHDCGGLTQSEEIEIEKICTQLCKTHELLDAITCEHLIHGLVATKSQWKDGLKLLEMLKLTAVPSTSAYVELIVKAFGSGEMEIGSRLLEELVSQRKQPKCEIYVTYLESIASQPETFKHNFEKLLVFLEKHELGLTQKVSKYIETLAQNTVLGIKAKATFVNRVGKCGNCGDHMQHVAISETEYKKLRDSFLQKVLIRNDIFQKSTPEEVTQFKRFVEETAPYDCVIDGLNVAYSKGSKRSPNELANLLASVVRYFGNRGKSVLVLGRKHMNSWPKDIMKYVRKYARVYLTSNLTHDDPFMLYATLKSGQSTDFFSRDLMRSHAYLLGPELKPIFRRWQQEHQFSLVTQTNDGKVIVKEPVRYLTCAHKINGTWHLPLTAEYITHLPESFEIPDSWLCLKFENFN